MPKQRQPMFPFPVKRQETSELAPHEREQPDYPNLAEPATAPGSIPNVKLAHWELANNRARLRKKPEQKRR